MPINRDFIGREYPADEIYEVSREKIRDFALAIGDPNPIYLDADAAKAAGHPDVVAPPTFLTVLGFRFAMNSPIVDPDFGLNYALVVHGEQRFVAHRPVYAGDRLVSTQIVDDIRDAGRNELASTRTEVSTDSGVPVATVYASLVSRGTAAGGKA
jgi:acyl dehydratase